MDWAEFNAEIDTLIQDDTSFPQPSYPQIVRVQAYNRACQFFAVKHTALIKVASLSTLTPAHGGMLATLPAGFIQPRMILRGGYPLFADDFVVMSGTTLWLRGDDTSPAELWYYSQYATMLPPVTGQPSQTIDLPDWSIWGIQNLTCAILLYPAMFGQALLRQFQSRAEAGDPVDNPPREQAAFYFAVYRDHVMAVPPQERTLITG